LSSKGAKGNTNVQGRIKSSGQRNKINARKRSDKGSGTDTRSGKAGKFRPIINLKRLNQYMPYAHFKMEGLKNIRELLNHGDYMVKIDLKDAY